jgi:hypothetical protein
MMPLDLDLSDDELIELERFLASGPPRKSSEST